MVMVKVMVMGDVNVCGSRSISISGSALARSLCMLPEIPAKILFPANSYDESYTVGTVSNFTYAFLRG